MSAGPAALGPRPAVAGYGGDRRREGRVAVVRKSLWVGVLALACSALGAGCSCADEPAAPVVAPSPAPAVAQLDEPPTSQAEDPVPGPFVRGIRGGPLLRLGKDHSGELVVQGDKVSLHVIHRSRKPLPASGEVALRIKPQGGDELDLVMHPDPSGERWLATVPPVEVDAEAVVTMKIGEETVSGAIIWAEAEAGQAPPRSVKPIEPSKSPTETP